MNDFDLYQIHIEQVTQNRINELLRNEQIPSTLAERFKNFIYHDGYSVFDLNPLWLRRLKHIAQNNIYVDDAELHKLVFKSYVDPLQTSPTRREWICNASQ